MNPSIASLLLKGRKINDFLLDMGQGQVIFSSATLGPLRDPCCKAHISSNVGVRTLPVFFWGPLEAFMCEDLFHTGVLIHSSACFMAGSVSSAL